MTNSYRIQLEKAAKQALLDITRDSKTLKEHLSEEDHLKLSAKIKKMTYIETISSLFNEGEMLTEFGIRDFESKFKKWVKYGMAAVAGMVLLKGMPKRLSPAVGMLVLYLFRKFTDPCYQKCFKKFGQSKIRKQCKAQCHVDASQAIVNDIQKEIEKCENTQNPLSCERKLNKQYITWSKKLQTYMVTLQKAKAEVGVSRKPY